MSDPKQTLAKLKALSEELVLMKQDVIQYKKLFLEDDGKIDEQEQAHLDAMLAEIQRVVSHIDTLKAEAGNAGGTTAPDTTTAPTSKSSSPSGDKDTASSKTSGCDPAEIRAITQRYNDMIARARGLGKNVAADNLQRFIDGTGGTKQIDVTWLRGFDSVIDAESRILGYTEGEGSNNLKVWAPTIAEGANENKTDYWIGDIKEYSLTSELAYASGASKIRGEVSMDFSRTSDIVTITGTVTMNWWDDYNWNKGMSFYIPGSGSISDDDGLYLKRCAGAKDFRMEASWTFNYSGTYDAAQGRWTKNEWFINGQSYTPTHSEIDTDER